MSFCQVFQNILDEREEPGAVVHQTLELVGPMLALEFKAQFNNSNTLTLDQAALTEKPIQYMTITGSC